MSFGEEDSIFSVSQKRDIAAQLIRLRACYARYQATHDGDLGEISRQFVGFHNIDWDVDTVEEFIRLGGIPDLLFAVREFRIKNFKPSYPERVHDWLFWVCENMIKVEVAAAFQSEQERVIPEIVACLSSPVPELVEGAYRCLRCVARYLVFKLWEFDIIDVLRKTILTSCDSHLDLSSMAVELLGVFVYEFEIRRYPMVMAQPYIQLLLDSIRLPKTSKETRGIALTAVGRSLNDNDFAEFVFGEGFLDEVMQLIDEDVCYIGGCTRILANLILLNENMRNIVLDLGAMPALCGAIEEFGRSLESAQDLEFKHDPVISCALSAFACVADAGPPKYKQLLFTDQVANTIIAHIQPYHSYHVLDLFHPFLRTSDPTVYDALLATYPVVWFCTMAIKTDYQDGNNHDIRTMQKLVDEEYSKKLIRNAIKFRHLTLDTLPVMKTLRNSATNFLKLEGLGLNDRAIAVWILCLLIFGFDWHTVEHKDEPTLYQQGMVLRREFQAGFYHLRSLTWLIAEFSTRRVGSRDPTRRAVPDTVWRILAECILNAGPVVMF